MGFYANVIFPCCFDLVRNSAHLRKYREEFLANVTGNILEIGFGSGLNLVHYPDHVKEITTVDPNPGLGKKSLKRIKKSPIKVNHYMQSGEYLPFNDNCFDSVVSSWTLCSIPNLDKALSEIYRVLNPDGRFFFLEHGLSNDKKIQRWQDRFTPFQKVIAVGCHLNRDMENVLHHHKFKIIDLEKFYMKWEPKTHGYTYLGVATKFMTHQIR